MKTAAPLARPSETHLTDDEYRLLWATSTDAIVIMDEQGTIRYANPATPFVRSNERRPKRK
jgi:PAS domain-containing protein